MFNQLNSMANIPEFLVGFLVAAFTYYLVLYTPVC